MKITWLGHSAFRLDTARAHILVDPFLNGNPAFAGQDRKDAVKDITHIVLTHGHSDHIGDTLAIANERDIPVIANFDLCMWLSKKGLKKFDGGNTGGTIRLDGFSATFTQALHSSASITEDGISHSLGSANGIMFHFDDEPTLFHMGDTDIFSDMGLINELHQPDIGLVPIGDRFTMGGAVAALACQRYFKFETILPCHYGSFPMIDQTPDTFVAAMEGVDTRIETPKAGGVVTV